MKKPKKYKCGIVLSGGAVRGFAHIGVLKALNEADIYPDVISATSAGSIIGALYADGYSPDEIFKMFADKSLLRFLEFIIPSRGFVKMTGLYKVLAKNLRTKNIEDLKIPLFITLTDMNNAKPVYIDSGNIGLSVIASSSIPLLFPPIVIKGITYVDGGIMNNLPIEPIKNQCEKIIGVNINPITFQKDFSSMVDVADRAAHMLIQSGIFQKKKNFNLYIEPLKLANYGLFDMSKGEEIFETGYNEAKSIIQKHLKKTKKSI